MPTDYAANRADVMAAARRLADYVHRTPVVTSRTLNKLAGAELFFKCENLQRVGAFKFRGACNAVLQLPDDAAGRGVVTHSSGNHAQGLALAAALRGIDAHIVMPDNAPEIKKRAVADYGASIYYCEPTLEGRKETARRVLEETGATFVSPFDHPHIIAGQGTATLELLSEIPDLDAIVAPIGGGGLMSGACIAATGHASKVRLIGAEPLGADDAARSFAAKKLIPASTPNTIADGLLTGLGEYTWPILRDHLERIVTVTDDQIIAAMRLVWERMKLIIEPSAAVPVAAVLTKEFRQVTPPPSRIGVIFSGGNVDLSRRFW